MFIMFNANRLIDINSVLDHQWQQVASSFLLASSASLLCIRSSKSLLEVSNFKKEKPGRLGTRHPEASAYNGISLLGSWCCLGQHHRCLVLLSYDVNEGKFEALSNMNQNQLFRKWLSHA